MKILHIMTMPLPFFRFNPWDGWHNRIAREILKLTPEHQLHCWTIERSLKEELRQDDGGMDCRVFPCRYLPGIGLDWSPLLLKALEQELEGGPLLVHLHSVAFPLTHAIARRCSRVPLVATQYLNRFPLRGELALKLRTGNVLGAGRSILLRSLEAIPNRTALKNIDRLLVLNRQLKAYFDPLIGEKRVEVLPLGIEFDRFHPGDKGQVRAKLGLEENGRYILYLGAMIRLKGLDYLLRAFARVCQNHNDASLLLAGEGGARVELEALARSLGIGERTRFLGYVDNRQAPQWYQAADVFVLPSWNEALGVVAIEALASGLAFIGTQVGGIPDIVANFKGGALVPSRDSSALAEALERVLAEPELFKGDRASGERHYAWRNVIRVLLGIYDGLWQRYYH